MGTLDTPNLETSPTFGVPVPDPAAEPIPDPDESLPTVLAEPAPEPDRLPRSGSACRFCGIRCDRAALVVGGIFRLPLDVPAPDDAIDVRRVRVSRTMDAVDHARAEEALAAGDMAEYARARSGARRVVQQVTTPVWRVCAGCAELPASPDALTLTIAALGQPAGRRTPTTTYVASELPVRAYFRVAGAAPNDPGHATPWQHADTELVAARSLLAELTAAGGIPSPTGHACPLCGTTHSLFGWSDRKWWSPVPVPTARGGLYVCDGFRMEPGDRQKHPMARPIRRRVGCQQLVDQPAQAGPLWERVLRAAQAAGADPPGPAILPADRGRLLAVEHPDYARLSAATPRPPWWHIADVPVPPPDLAEDLRKRVAALERQLAGATP